MKSKFLVLYPNADNLDLIIKKANIQHAKNGPFDVVILLGSCFPAEPTITVPDAPTYFFGKLDQPENFIDVGTNFTCIRSHRATLKLESGITLAFLNDTVTPDSDSDTTDATLKADVLISYNWPYCIAANQRLTLVGDLAVDNVVKSLQPRYHFAAGSEMGKLYEHNAVAWSPKRSYRFISLAREGTGSKWFYAFGIDTADDDAPTDVTNPFSQKPLKRLREEDNDKPSARQLRIEASDQKHVNEPKRVKLVPPSQCFFCLSNPKLESHMIVSIGKSAYLTIAKGPLTQPSRVLPFSGHAIVIPIEHSPTLPDEAELKQDIEQFKTSLARAFEGKGFDVVFYEICRPENVHYHIQMVPVPKGLIGKMFERALDEKSHINNETFDYNTKLNFRKYASGDIVPAEPRCIKFSVYSESNWVSYVSTLEEDKSVDLQFPRRVLAFLLRLPKRVKWDRCKQTPGQETAECQKFKQFYEPFDFTK